MNEQMGHRVDDPVWMGRTPRYVDDRRKRPDIAIAIKSVREVLVVGKPAIWMRCGRAYGPEPLGAGLVAPGTGNAAVAGARSHAHAGQTVTRVEQVPDSVDTRSAQYLGPAVLCE